MLSDCESLLMTSSQEEILDDLKREHGGLLNNLLQEDFIDLNDFANNEPIGMEAFNAPFDGFQGQAFNTLPQCTPMTATCKLPSIEDYPGQLGFCLELLGQNSNEKSWIYSTSLNKIFINMNKILPIRFQWKQNMVETQLHVRALLVFTTSQNFQYPVERCFHHISPVDISNKNFEFVDHIIRSEHPAATYWHDKESGRRSVVVPLDIPQPGDDTVTAMYTFHCKNSCASGMNRRATRIIFTLEDDQGIVKGRQTLKLRICSCPKRDYVKEEEDLRDAPKPKPTKRPRTSDTHNKNIKKEDDMRTSHTSNKKMKLDDDKIRMVQLPIKGTENIQFILRSCMGLVTSKAKEEGREMNDDEQYLEKQYIAMLKEISS